MSAEEMSSAEQGAMDAEALDAPFAKRPADATLGTYVGVFRPTILTIIGLILYLRAGWVVGQAGLLGALACIGLTFVITGATALSFASITTNIRIGAGGAFALVARSLGLEAGGAIGIPLYLAQALSIAFYMHGFSEGWLYLFPGHEVHWVLAGVFVGGFSLSFLSERLTLGMQLVVLFGVVAALISMWAGIFTVDELTAPTWLPSNGEIEFWSVFSVFFPAGTGIMVGASMSGKLRSPREAIPRGILGAWAVAFAIYVVTAVWYSVVASSELLRADSLVSVKRAAFGPLVLIGLMSSCISAMLGSIVAAPNVLQALASHRLVPGSRLLREKSKGGTARWAVVATGSLCGVALAFGDLDRIAAVITVLFLITYATINLVVLVEQSLKMISFRPRLEVPVVVPLFGVSSSVAVMVQTDRSLGLFALVAVVAIYLLLVRRRVRTPWETVRSGLVVAAAHWVVRATQKVKGPHYRAWVPDLLVPILSGERLMHHLPLLSAVVRPRGGVRLLSVEVGDDAGRRDEEHGAAIQAAAQMMRSQGSIAHRAEIRSADVATGVETAMELLADSVDRPRVLVVDPEEHPPDAVDALARVASDAGVGLLLVSTPRAPELREGSVVDIWLRFQPLEAIAGLSKSNVDLLLLLGYQLMRNAGVGLTLVTVAPPSAEAEAADFLRVVAEEARLPDSVGRVVLVGTFPDVLGEAPAAELHLFGMPDSIGRAALEDRVASLGSGALFVRDSGFESAFA